MGTVAPFALFGAVIAVGVLLEVVADRRGRRRIQEWATTNGYVIQQLERDRLSLSNSRTFRIFHTTVVDAKGETRTATWRIGGGIGGVAADDYEVKWDTEANTR